MTLQVMLPFSGTCICVLILETGFTKTYENAELLVQTTHAGALLYFSNCNVKHMQALRAGTAPLAYNDKIWLILFYTQRNTGIVTSNVPGG